MSQHNEPDAEQSRPPRPKTSCSFLQIFYGRRLMAPIKKKKKTFYRLACVRPHGDAAQTPKSSRRLRVNGPTDGRPESQTPHIIYVRIRTFPGAARPAAPPTIRLPIPTHIRRGKHILWIQITASGNALGGAVLYIVTQTVCKHLDRRMNSERCLTAHLVRWRRRRRRRCGPSISGHVYTAHNHHLYHTNHHRFVCAY